MDADIHAISSERGEPHWQALSPRQRRVVGVLVEKAKTTPDAYPMTASAIVSASNQKTNRLPLMNLTADEVEDTVAELRELGAVTEVQSGGRVARYKHRMYEWLGVDKVELAVMAELLLRGDQTVGELRARAARMEPIADLNTLKPILQGLLQKNLIMSLTPEGRGQVVTHNLYKPRELDELRARHAGGAVAARDETAMDDTSPEPQQRRVTPDMFAELQLEVAELRAELMRLRERVNQLEGRQVG
jgi:uncharacterized protein YceH (UPF0502 family)